ncbi:MAG: GNAT family N-acetyltransferase [Burkholderiales bacterium]
MWKFDEHLDSARWDALVAANRGNPLQTALWAAARANADGMQSERFVLERDGRLVLLARVEVRRHRLAGKVAWIPQGPVFVDLDLAFEGSLALKTELKSRGYHLCFESPYPEAPPRYREHGTPFGGPAHTSVVDLSVGERMLWDRLSSNWRNNVRAAERSGMRVAEADDSDSIRQFVAECVQLSTSKGFRYQGSEPLISCLLRDSSTPDVVAKLYCASLDDSFRGGVLVMIVGKSMQLMFSASGRNEPSPGRLLQWTAMKAAMAADVTRYDLGGMDPEGNRGVYEFKRQLRGKLLTVPPIRASALGLRGKVALLGVKMLGGV